MRIISTNMLSELFNAREENLSEKTGVTSENKQEFLEIVEKVENSELRKQLVRVYLQDEDIVGTECARLCKQYYLNGFIDSTNLLLECINDGLK